MTESISTYQSGRRPAQGAILASRLAALMSRKRSQAAAKIWPASIAGHGLSVEYLLYATLTTLKDGFCQKLKL